MTRANARIKKKSKLAHGAIIFRHFTFTKYSHTFLRVFLISGVPETLHLEKLWTVRPWERSRID